MARRARGGLAPGVPQDTPRGFALLNQPLQGVLRDRGRGPRPAPAHPPWLAQEPPLPPDAPAPLGEALPAARWRTPAGAPGVEHLDALRVEAAEDRRGGQEGRRPVVRGREETQEPRPRGPAGEPGPRGARPPPRARPLAHACERGPAPPGDDRAGPEVRLGGCGAGAQRLIAFIAQGGDTLHGPPTALLSSPGGPASPRGRVVGGRQAHKRT